MKKKIYLAIPFSGIEELSYKAANEVAAQLIKDGYIVFSPITHSYPLWKTERMAHTYDVWLEQDKAFIEWCDKICLVVIDGNFLWGRKSKGVRQEMHWALEMGKEFSIIEFNSENGRVEYYPKDSIKEWIRRNESILI